MQRQFHWRNSHVSFSDATGDRSRYNLLRNQMISSAIWDKSEPVNFSGLTKFAGLIKFSRADLSQITQEKSCGYLLIIYMQKCESLFLFYVSPHITVPCSRLQMTTTIKSGQNFDRRILECLERKNNAFFLFQLADHLLMNCPTLWPPKEKSWDSLVQFASISARKEVMYEQGLFISTLTKFNPKKVPRVN